MPLAAARVLDRVARLVVGREQPADGGEDQVLRRRRGSVPALALVERREPEQLRAQPSPRRLVGRERADLLLEGAEPVVQPIPRR